MSTAENDFLADGLSLEQIALTEGELKLEELNKIEDLAKLQHQLKAVLKERFIKNIECFYKYMPDIAKIFADYHPKRPMDFFCTDNGIPNLIFTDNNDIVYKGWDPAKLCALQIENVLENTGLKQTHYGKEKDSYGQIHYKYNKAAISIDEGLEHTYPTCKKLGSVPNAMLLGVGLGYAVGELYSKVEMANLFIVEPDLDMMYASLYAFTWHDLLPFIFENNYGLHLMLGQTEEQFFFDMSNFYNKHGRFLAGTWLGIVHLHNQKISKIIEVIKKEYANVYSALGFFDDNLFGVSHATKAILDKKSFVRGDYELTNNLKNAPVFIIGSGPSLDKDIQFLRKNQDKAIIIACGTAIDTLYHAGIKPDFYACTERTPEISEALSTVPDKSFYDDITLLCGDVIHPNTTKLFKHTAIFGKMDESFYTYALAKIKDFRNIQCVQLMNPLVGNMGVSGALYLGFRNLYLFGLDNGKKIGSEIMHSKYTTLYHQHGTQDSSGNYAINDVVEANFDGKCSSNFFFKLSAYNIGFILGIFKDKKISCINCSDGAKINNTKAVHSYDLDFSKQKEIDKEAMRKIIWEKKTKEVKLTEDEQKDLFSLDFFNKVCSKVKEYLTKEVKGRIDLVQILESATEYVTYLKLQPNVSIYGTCLGGTLQTMYIVLMHALYANEDEQKCLEAALKIRDNIIEFLDEAPSLFKHLPNYILGEHQNYFENGKVGRDTTYGGEAPPLPKLRKLIKKQFDDPQKIFEKRYS